MQEAGKTQHVRHYHLCAELRREEGSLLAAPVVMEEYCIQIGLVGFYSLIEYAYVQVG
jgi:hypothetical protein